MSCPVCDGRGWLYAAPVQESRARWDDALATPCWACWPTNQKVIA